MVRNVTFTDKDTNGKVLKKIFPDMTYKRYPKDGVVLFRFSTYDGWNNGAELSWWDAKYIDTKGENNE